MTEQLLQTVSPSPSSDAERRAMIVADDAHVTYKVYASGKRFNAREDLLSLRSLRGGRGLQTVPALRGVSFTASEGETIGVVGHNGSGKSTLFRAMSGLIPTSEGTIWAADRPVLLGVNAALVPDLSGENNIKLGLLAMGFSAEEAAARVDEIADFAELNEFIHHPMRTYSSGMGARLRFAIASAKAHSILLIDEALSVGDRRFKLKSEQRIRELRDTAGLVMIVSHSVNSLKDTCDRVLWIHKGELRADGPTADVIADYVTWTKQPGSAAVGAASSAKAKASRPEKVRQTTAASAVGMAASSTATEQLDLERDAETPTAPARRSPRIGSTKAVAVPPKIPRDAVRRNRYHRSARENTRKRIIALTITAVSILIAIGAGVAIALVANLPGPQESAPTLSPAAAPKPGDSTPPVIRAFAPGTPAAACEMPDGEVELHLTWEVEDATRITLAAGQSEADAIDGLLQTDLPALALAHPVPFVCTDETRTYTLTVDGEDGSRIRSVITVARQLAEEPEPTPSPQRPQGPRAPVVPPAPGPVSPNQPEPSTQPEPPAQPEPQPEPEPEPQPEPEPTLEPQPDPTDVLLPG